MKNFKEWIRQFESEDSVLGDLAYDIWRDDSFPKSNSKKIILNHMTDQEACDEAKEAFADAFEIYTEEAHQ